MGGKLLDNATIVNFGLNLTDSCMNTYNTPTGIGGGGFAFVTADGKGTPPNSAAQQAEFKSFGFYNTCVFLIAYGEAPSESASAAITVGTCARRSSRQVLKSFLSHTLPLTIWVAECSLRVARDGRPEISIVVSSDSGVAFLTIIPHQMGGGCPSKYHQVREGPRRIHFLERRDPNRSFDGQPRR
jgi:hypothetical protein